LFSVVMRNAPGGSVGTNCIVWRCPVNVKDAV
jgi:hypothetical protein